MSRQARTVITVATCVLLLHVAAIWALELGLKARKPEVEMPVQLLARIVGPRPLATAPQPVRAPAQTLPGPAPVMRKPPAPEPTPAVRKPPAPEPTPAERKPPTPEPTTAERKPPTPETAAAVAERSATPMPQTIAPAPAPAPASVSASAPAPALAVAEPTTTPTAPPVTATPGANAPPANHQAAEPATAAATTATAAAAIGPGLAPAPVRRVSPAVELPSSDALYLQNPRPRYPPISLRLREQGTVLVNVLVSEQGLAQEARVRTSSGYFRLDHSAVSTVLTWRFVPGTRNGVAESMWFIVPIEFNFH